MAKTIIQTIGPLYGEVVNGTVFGRPNGSVYIPPTNKISLTMPTPYLLAAATYIATANSSGTVTGRAIVVAESQDLASHCIIQVATDSDFNSVVASGTWNAGQFNFASAVIGSGSGILDEVSDGSALYVRAQLITANNVPVATSDVATLTAVVL